MRHHCTRTRNALPDTAQEACQNFTCGEHVAGSFCQRGCCMLWQFQLQCAEKGHAGQCISARKHNLELKQTGKGCV